jgi:hypothetical protein
LADAMCSRGCRSARAPFVPLAVSRRQSFSMSLLQNLGDVECQLAYLPRPPAPGPPRPELRLCQKYFGRAWHGRPAAGPGNKTRDGRPRGGSASPGASPPGPDVRRGPGKRGGPARMRGGGPESGIQGGPLVPGRPAARGQHSGLIGRCEPAERHLERASCEWSQSIMRRAAVSSYVISVFLDACGPRDREIGVLSLPSYRISLRGAQARRSGQTS